MHKEEDDEAYLNDGKMFESLYTMRNFYTKRNFEFTNMFTDMHEYDYKIRFNESVFRKSKHYPKANHRRVQSTFSGSNFENSDYT